MSVSVNAFVFAVCTPISGSYTHWWENPEEGGSVCCQSTHHDGHCRWLLSAEHPQVRISHLKHLCPPFSVSMENVSIFEQGQNVCKIPSKRPKQLKIFLEILFRYLLKFGDVSYYLGYNALQDFFPSMAMKPNPQCDDNHCQRQQKLFQVKTEQINWIATVDINLKNILMILHSRSWCKEKD